MGITSKYKLKKTENTNTIMDLKNYNNFNWERLEDLIISATDGSNDAIYIGAEPPGKNHPHAVVWIDPTTNYDDPTGCYISTSEDEPIDPNVVLWLDRDE